MKKTYILILGLFLIVVVGAALWQVWKKEGLPIAGVLPTGPLVYIHLQDAEKNLKEAASLPMWDGFKKIDFNLLAKRNIISVQQGMMIELIRHQASEVLDSPLPGKFFGREIALAVYPPQEDVGALVQGLNIANVKSVEKLFSGTFLVTRVDSSIQMAEFIARFFKPYAANIASGQTAYKGEVIHTVTLSDIGVQFGAVRLKDLIVIGFGESPARSSVDVYKKDQNSFVRDQPYLELQRSLSNPSGLRGFLNYEKAVSLFNKNWAKVAGFVGQGDEQDRKQLDKALSYMAGLETIGFSSSLKPIPRFDSYIRMDSAKLNPEYAGMYLCSSQENRTVLFVPKNVLGYQWSNCFKFGYYWDEVKKEMASNKTPPSRINDLEANIGLSIERDILPAFGEEIGGYLADIQTGGFFPIPEFLFFVAVNDQAKAQHLLNRLNNLPLAVMREENHGGVVLKFLALPMGEVLQPGYCFLDNFLLVATSRQLLKDSIDAYGDRDKSLLSSPEFKKVNLGLTDKNRTVQFVKIGKLVDRIKDVIGWSQQWLASQDKKAQAFKAGSERPLEEVNAGIAMKEGELQAMIDRKAVLEDKIWDAELKGEEAGALRSELADLKKKTDARRAQIDDDYERKHELEEILSGPDKSPGNPALRQVYIDEIIVPILDGLKAVHSYGLRTTVEDNMIKSSIFLNITQ